jgi:beta-lactamase regulating signal transducer with metallopeptidase domain
MKLPEFIHIDLAWKLGWTILHSLWQGMLIALLHSIAMGFLRRGSPRARYAASLCGLALFLCAGVVTFELIVPPPHITADAHGSTPALMTMSKDVATSTSITPTPSAAAPEIAAAPSTTDSFAGFDRFRDFFRSGISRLEYATPWIAGIWAMGVLLIGVWHTGGWIATRRMCVLGVTPVDSQVVAILARVAERLEVTRLLRVFQSTLVKTPVVIGWLAPVILLPAAVLSGLTAVQLEAILAHEIAHVRRHDYIVNLLEVIAETLMFYHPVAWRISRRIRLEREQCCDDIAIAVCGDRCAYAQSLAALEEVRLSPPLVLAARGSGGSELLTRVRRILSTEPDHGRRHARLTIIWAILIAAGFTALSCEKSRSQNQTSEVPTPDRLIEQLRFADRPIQNLHVIDFELTEEFQAEGSTQWQKTPFRMAGSAWYGDPTSGQARIDVTQQTLPTQSHVGPWMEMAYTAVFDGQQGRMLRHTMGEIGKAAPLLRAINYPPGKLPEELEPFAFNRFATGTAYAPAFHAKRDAGFATSLRNGLDRGIKLNISLDVVNGRPAIKLAPTWVNQKPSSLSITWFDPEHGYAYLGKERAIGGKIAESERITDFANAAPGVWFPLRAWRETPTEDPAAPKGLHRYTYKAKAVVANDPAFDPAIFTVAIPGNYAVIDMKPPATTEATIFPAPSATALGVLEDKNRRRSANNLKAIGMGLTLYANEMHGLYPPDLVILAKTEEMSNDMVKSPMGNAQVGYAYAYLHFRAMTHGLPADLAIAYDAPDAAQSGGACVLFGDGHVQWLDAASLQTALKHAEAVRNRIESKPEPATLPTR